DHHGGYPGHYGEGRTAVYAPELSRAAILEAVRRRHCYAVTGDKIEIAFHVDDAMMGDEMRSSGLRHLTYAVRGGDVIDRVEIVKNGKVLQRAYPHDGEPAGGEATCKVRVEWGWGDKDDHVTWDGCVRVEGGSIVSVEPCFNGEPVLAPSTKG